MRRNLKNEAESEEKKKMFVAIGILFILAGAMMVWFHIPYSPVKSDFQKDVSTLFANNHLSEAGGIFQKEDFAHCPTAIQKYIEHCGYIGTPKNVLSENGIQQC